MLKFGFQHMFQATGETLKAVNSKHRHRKLHVSFSVIQYDRLFLPLSQAH